MHSAIALKLSSVPFMCVKEMQRAKNEAYTEVTEFRDRLPFVYSSSNDKMVDLVSMNFQNQNLECNFTNNEKLRTEDKVDRTCSLNLPDKKSNTTFL